MKDTRIEIAVTRAVCSWVEHVRVRGAAISWACVIATLLLGAYTATNLGINSDNLGLVSDQLPSRQANAEFSSLFPALDEALLIVVDAETPELARSGTETLVAALEARPDLFGGTYEPGGGAFFEEHGLLYRSLDDLDSFAEQMARMQPVLAELERDTSIAQLSELVQLALDDLHSRETGAAEWSLVLDQVSQATVNAYEEFPITISWEELLLRGSSIDVSTRRLIITLPKLDFRNLFAAGDALDAIREAARGAGLVPERGVTVRITGNPALNYEEMIGLMWDIAGAGAFCFAIVAVILYVALRSARIVGAALATLLIGLVWTAAFAALAVGYLNIVSITFAVLFIGLGVDFGIHLGMSYASHRRRGLSHADSLQEAVSAIGSSLVLCSITTAIGFFVFVPTHYRGVAELGLIAGTGMFVILFLFLTLFPALLSSWLAVDPERSLRSDLHFRLHWWQPFHDHPRTVRVVALLAFVAAIALLPRARFSPNVIAMRNPGTESVQAFNDLLGEPGTAPWYINVVRPDIESARALAERVRALPTVGRVLTIEDFVPTLQEDKLEVLGDVAMMLDVPAGESGGDARASPQDQIAAIRELHDFFDAPWMAEKDTLLAQSIRKLQSHLAVFLERVEREGNPEQALAALEVVLFATLHDQIDRMQRAVRTRGVTREDLPRDLALRMQSPDGRFRVQIFPEGDLRDLDSMKGFVAEVQTVAPNATSVVVNLVEFGRVTVDSFRQALTSAVVVIALLLLLIWRSPIDAGLALAPLLLAAALTGAAMVVFDFAFDFTNVIVIPLLFGIGVDSGIHLVHRWKAQEPGGDLLGTTTARAVFYSALTTTVSFGSLGLSSHQGMSTLGAMLAAGMVFTIVCNLVVLPSLLDLRERPDEPPVEARSAAVPTA